MSDIAQWLDALALGRYAQSFAENDIEWRVLPQLTDDDLRELGVSLGHRKLMMQAIAALGAGAAVCETTNTAPASATLPVNERRFLIVMFCDLVGSTERAASMDPEDWRDLAAEYHRRTAQAVTRFNGYVAKNLGDGVMVYFGYPQAQESDAERAVHAGLAILDAMALMASELAEQGKAALEVRVGIHAGAMVLDGSADVFGDVPNIAARVQSAAAAGTLLISPALHDTVAHLFIVDDLGPHALKGVAIPLNLFRVVRPSQAQGKLQSADLTALIGRQEEILILQKRWQRACTGAGQLVLIEAEPGLGKSRLIEEMRRQLPEHGPLWVTWRCSHMLQGARFHPLVEWARRRFGGPEQAAPQRLANFESALAAVGLDLAIHVPLLAPVLDLPMGTAYPPLQLAAEERQRCQTGALVNWIRAAAQAQSVVIAIEDVHWADPSTLSMLALLAEQVHDMKALVLVAARPQFRAQWAHRSHHTTITLAPLGGDDVRAMVGQIATRLLDRDVIDILVSRTGGVPLFVEELTRLLLEGAVDGKQIPPTLQASLTARLDMLGGAREVAQIGAVLGRDFDYALLLLVCKLDEPTLQAALDRLVDSGLIQARGVAPQASYRFKHALIQDAAYESLLKSRRRELHAGVAAALIGPLKKFSKAQPELLALHLTGAGDIEAAINAWQRAAIWAIGNSAYAEAIAHVRTAIGLTDALGAGQALRRLQLYETMWTGLFVRAEIASMKEIGAEALQEAQNWPDTIEAASANFMCGNNCWLEGEWLSARHYLERAIAIVDGETTGASFQSVLNLHTSGHGWLGLVLGMMGEMRQARYQLERALALAQQYQNPGALMDAHVLMAVYELLVGHPESTETHALAALELSNTQSTGNWLPAALFALGWAHARQGDLAAGMAEMEQALDLWRQTGARLYFAYFASQLAQLQAEAGQLPAALALLDRALESIRLTGEVDHEDEVYCVRGKVLMMHNPPEVEAAQACFERALAIAQPRQARIIALRAALELAGLFAGSGRASLIPGALLPAMAGLEESADLPELAQAHRLLA